MDERAETMAAQVTDALVELCSSRETYVLDPDTVSVKSGFVLPDGDDLPVLLRRDASGRWRLTDDNITAGRLDLLGVPATVTTIDQIRSIVTSSGGLLSDDLEVSVPLRAQLSGYDIQQFAGIVWKLLALGDLPAPSPRGAQFPTTVRDTIEELVAPSVRVYRNWTGEASSSKFYPVDVAVISERERWFVWTVSGVDQADTPIVCGGHHQGAENTNFSAVLNVQRSPRPDELQRLQLSFPGDLVWMNPGDTTTMRDELQKKGIPVA